jgi:hypothetical protein
MRGQGLSGDAGTLMRIIGPNAAGGVATAPATRRTAAGGFAVSDNESPRAATSSPSLRTIGGIDALIALQGLETATERRKRAVYRGTRTLDALDDLKIGLLGGNLDPTALGRLKAATALLRDGSGDDRLDHVLAEIELRAAVELAKFGPKP